MTYRIDQHGILHDSGGGCQSASAAEEEFWAEIEQLRAALVSIGIINASGGRPDPEIDKIVREFAVDQQNRKIGDE